MEKSDRRGKNRTIKLKNKEKEMSEKDVLSELGERFASVMEQNIEALGEAMKVVEGAREFEERFKRLEDFASQAVERINNIHILIESTLATFVALGLVDQEKMSTTFKEVYNKTMDTFNKKRGGTVEHVCKCGGEHEQAEGVVVGEGTQG